MDFGKQMRWMHRLTVISQRKPSHFGWTAHLLAYPIGCELFESRARFLSSLHSWLRTMSSTVWSKGTSSIGEVNNANPKHKWCLWEHMHCQCECVRSEEEGGPAPSLRASKFLSTQLTCPTGQPTFLLRRMGWLVDKPSLTARGQRLQWGHRSWGFYGLWWQDPFLTFGH